MASRDTIGCPVSVFSVHLLGIVISLRGHSKEKQTADKTRRSKPSDQKRPA
jgi:hypothetical protein